MYDHPFFILLNVAVGGGFVGARCPVGQGCYDDPRDDCAPPEGADCGGLCVPQADVCSAVVPGEFGDCRALIGWANAGRGCVQVSGCGCTAACAGRVFPTQAECANTCLR